MYSEVMVEAVIQSRERERELHVAEGRRLLALAAPAHPEPAARPAPAMPTLGRWLAWLQDHQTRRAAAAA